MSRLPETADDHPSKNDRQQLKITATQSAEEKAKVEPDGQQKERALHLNMELVYDQTLPPIARRKFECVRQPDNTLIVAKAESGCL